jgi:mannose-6-phosphate isomerase-like protein (cupin superfamily)
MKKLICSIFALACAAPVPLVWAQTATPTPNTAVVIPNAEMQAKLKEMIEKKVQDDSVRVVNAGESNVGVFFVHLNPGQPPPEPVQLMSHNDVTELYYVIKGEGTLYHGGTIENPTPRDLATTGGPSKTGPGQNKLVQNVGPGDIFIVPPNTPHQVNLGAKTEIVYLIVRIDPKKHLQLK